MDMGNGFFIWGGLYLVHPILDEENWVLGSLKGFHMQQEELVDDLCELTEDRMVWSGGVV